MKELLVPIDNTGRFVLPKNVRHELAIKPGDLFKVSIQGSAVILTPTRETFGFIRKGKALVFTSSSDETLSNKTVNDALRNLRKKPLREVKTNVTRKSVRNESFRTHTST